MNTMDSLLQFDYTQPASSHKYRRPASDYPAWMLYQSIDKHVPVVDTTSTAQRRTVWRPDELHAILNAWPQLLRDSEAPPLEPDFAATEFASGESATLEMSHPLDDMYTVDTDFGFPMGFPEFLQEISVAPFPEPSFFEEVPVTAPTHVQDRDINPNKDQADADFFDFNAALMPKPWELRGEWYSPGSTPRPSPAPLPSLDECRDSSPSSVDSPAPATPVLGSPHPDTLPRKRGTTSSPVKAKVTAKTSARKRAPPREVAIKTTTTTKKGKERAATPPPCPLPCPPPLCPTFRFDLSHMVKNEDDEYVYEQQEDSNRLDDDDNDDDKDFLPSPSNRGRRGVIRKRACPTSSRPRKRVKKSKTDDADDEYDENGADANSYSDADLCDVMRNPEPVSFVTEFGKLCARGNVRGKKPVSGLLCGIPDPEEGGRMCAHHSRNHHELFKHREVHFLGRFDCPGNCGLTSITRWDSLKRHFRAVRSNKGTMVRNGEVVDVNCAKLVGPNSKLWGTNGARFESHRPVWMQPGWMAMNAPRGWMPVGWH